MSHGVPFKLGPPDGRSYPFRVVANGERSNGLALGDTKIPAGTPGPARHVHTHEDEALYVLSGVLTVEVGDERYDAASESFVFMPRGLPHAFGNLGEQGRVLPQVGVAGQVRVLGRGAGVLQRDDVGHVERGANHAFSAVGETYDRRLRVQVSDAAVGATDSYWLPEHVVTGEQDRSDVAVGAVDAYWLTEHSVRSTEARSPSMWDSSRAAGATSRAANKRAVSSSSSSTAMADAGVSCQTLGPSRSSITLRMGVPRSP